MHIALPLWKADLLLQVRTGAAVFLSGMAAHLPADDGRIASIVATLKELLRTPSSVVQETASTALTPIARKLAGDDAQVLPACLPACLPPPLLLPQRRVFITGLDRVTLSIQGDQKVGTGADHGPASVPERLAQRCR